MEPVTIRTVKLSKVYSSGQEQVAVLQDVDLEVAAGERVAVTGESGAGKSTLLHLLGGLDRPSGGTIYFGSQDLTQLSESALAAFRNQQAGFVWQTQRLLPEFTALENVMMPLLIRGTPQQQAEPAARARLEEVGLKNRASHRSGELSGGEQQRVVLARALVGNPCVLLADEPTGNLDQRTGSAVMDLLDELHRAHPITTILVTHNPAHAARCDRILKLERGSFQPVAADLSHHGRDYV